jgi:SAM-dependent methyltransferase
MTYDANGVQAYFDTLAEREWERLESTVQGRSNYAVHQRFLDEHVRPGMRVLDVGSGPGRFAIDIVERGAQVTLADLSPVQLELARQRLGERGLLDRVEGFHRLDILDMGSIGDAAYDLVVAFGGVVSYTRERHRDAIGELVHVVRPGGAILISVMSLYGTLRLAGPLDAAAVMEAIDEHIDWQGVLSGADIVFTRAGSPEFHQPLALFTSAGLRAALEGAGLRVEALASANPLLPVYSRIPRIADSAVAAAAFIDLERAVCDRPGLVDSGGHMIAVARRPAA